VKYLLVLSHTYPVLPPAPKPWTRRRYMLNKPELRGQAQQREEEDPSERNRPIPAIVALITLAVVIFGVAYILLSEPFGQVDMGDRRTLADLRALRPMASRSLPPIARPVTKLAEKVCPVSFRRWTALNGWQAMSVR
jgi:hypothetical protein